MIKHPIYVISKGRSDNCFTANILQNENLKFKIVIEPQEKKLYIDKYGSSKCLIMDKNNQGISYVRNWTKYYSIKRKEKFHWCIDDNIKSFRVRKNNKNEKITASHCLSQAEKFVAKFKNIGGAGLSHVLFAWTKKTEFDLNKQIYSCVLLNNDLFIRYRKDITEDTDYSLQILTIDFYKWCTILFNRLLIEKVTTLTMKGGNTEMYKQDGRLIRSKGLQRKWPGAFKIKIKKGIVRIAPSRIWSSFKQKLIKE